MLLHDARPDIAVAPNGNPSRVALAAGATECARFATCFGGTDSLTPWGRAILAAAAALFPIVHDILKDIPNE
jgi:hypothetical protein